MCKYRQFAVRKKQTLLLVFIFSFFGIFSGIAQNCNSELNVYKNIDSRSASENDSTNFFLELTNNSDRSQTYQIEVINKNGSCVSNSANFSQQDSSVLLDVSIIKNNLRTNLITVPSRTSIEILANVSIPIGTPYNKWSCFEIRANSDNCTRGSVYTTIKVLVNNPSED